MKYSYEELAGMIDHALLHPTLTDTELRVGCELAARYGVASACVKPCAVKAAAEFLRGSGVVTGTVIGFPHGGSAIETKRYETVSACRDGATEIDMVINIGKTLSGDFEYVEHEIMEVVESAHQHGALAKIIFETDFLADDSVKIRLCEICAAASADFVKTSTGFGFVKQPGGGYDCKGATAHDLKLMRDHSPARVRVKASGGIRTLDDLILARDLGAARCGSSATASLLDEYRRREAAGVSLSGVDCGALGRGGY